jgi:hypothetical protein
MYTPLPSAGKYLLSSCNTKPVSGAPSCGLIRNPLSLAELMGHYTDRVKHDSPFITRLAVHLSLWHVNRRYRGGGGVGEPVCGSRDVSATGQ